MKKKMNSFLKKWVYKIRKSNYNIEKQLFDIIPLQMGR